MEVLTLCRIYISERKRHHHQPLWKRILEMGFEQGINGGTVLKGLAGYGNHHVIHTSEWSDIVEDLPVVIEFVEEEEKLKGLAASVESLLLENDLTGLITLENVKAIRVGKK